MNKKLELGILLLLSPVLLYLGGVLGGAFGVGLSIGAVACFIAATIGFFQKIAKHNKPSSHSQQKAVKSSTGPIVAIVALTALATFYVLNHQTNTEPILDSTSLTIELEKQATSLRMQLPKKINESITARNVTVSKDRIIYDMTLVSDVDESQLTTQLLKNPMVSTLCLNQDSRILLDANATFEYNYTHNGSGGVYKVAITKYDC